MKPRVRLSKYSAPDRARQIHVKVREIQVQKVPAGPGPAEREHARARETPAENVPAKPGPAEDILVPGQSGPGTAKQPPRAADGLAARVQARGWRAKTDP